MTWQGGGAVGRLWVPGGAYVPTCSYDPPVNPGHHSSYDVLGNRLTPQGVPTFENPAGRPVVTAVPAGGISLYGTLFVPSYFGISSGVFGGLQTFEARWSWDILGAGGVPMLCRAGLFGGSAFSGMSLDWSDDGVTWTPEVVGWSGVAALANLRHRYWSLHYGPENVGVPGLWYYPGHDMADVLLWGAY